MRKIEIPLIRRPIFRLIRVETRDPAKTRRINYLNNALQSPEFGIDSLRRTRSWTANDFGRAELGCRI